MSKLPKELIAAMEAAWEKASGENGTSEEILKLQKKIHKAKLILKELTHKNAQLQSLLKSSSEQYETELSNAKQHIQGLESALTEKEHQLQSEREKAIELECEINTLNEELQLAESSRESIKSLEADSELFEKQNKLLLTELDDRGTLLAQLQIETRRLSDNLKHQRDENHALLKGNAMLQSRTQQMSEKFDAMSDKLQVKERDIEDKQQHIDILQKKLRLAEQNIEHLESLNNTQ